MLVVDVSLVASIASFSLFACALLDSFQVKNRSYFGIVESFCSICSVMIVDIWEFDQDERRVIFQDCLNITFTTQV